LSLLYTLFQKKMIRLCSIRTNFFKRHEKMGGLKVVGGCTVEVIGSGVVDKGSGVVNYGSGLDNRGGLVDDRGNGSNGIDEAVL
jgi:hypothetical protein